MWLDDIDLTVGARCVEHYSVIDGEFTSVREEAECIRLMVHYDWSVSTRTRIWLTSDSRNF